MNSHNSRFLYLDSMSSPSVAGGYMLANDKKEGGRLDAQHELFKATFDGKLFFSPVSVPQAVLVVGCGTSNWAVDTAKLFPNAEVTGIDLGQPQPSEVPTNYQHSKTFTQVLECSKEELDTFLEEVRTDLMRDDRWWFMRIHVIYGQKPAED